MKTKTFWNVLVEKISSWQFHWGKGRLQSRYRLLFDSVLLGVVGALSAQLFTFLLGLAKSLFLSLIAGYQPPGLPNEGQPTPQIIGSHGLWLIPVVTTLGGLVAGVLIYSFAPEAEGHGTDTAVKAFHRDDGRIRARIPFLKMIASAITLGSGGAGGREGPTALISSGIGSLYANLTQRPAPERRLLVLIGMASGLAAIFRSPIGTAIFAIEVLYADMEFEAGALLYTMLGSVVAYAINGLFVGFQPLFSIPSLATPNDVDYLWYVVLGLLAGGLATIMPTIFYGVRDLFKAIPIPPHFKPAIGGLAVGLIELAFPQVIGGGYGWMQQAIDGLLPAWMLISLSFVMMIALSLTISSGGSGGVFAPSLFVGVMAGGFLAQVFHQSTAAFAVVGMAAVFAGAARVPIASLLMVTEMTNGYTLLVPAALAVTLSYIMQVFLTGRLKYKSLYEAQVKSRIDSPAHHPEVIGAVLNLIKNYPLKLPADITHLDLKMLLESGIPVDLPGEKQLAIGILPQGSALAGWSVQWIFPPDSDEDIEVVAVFRKNTTLLPHPEVILEFGDRLLVVADAKTWNARLGADLKSTSLYYHPEKRNGDNRPERET